MSTMLPSDTEELARSVAARSGKTVEEVLRAGVEMQARIAGVPLDDAHRVVKRVDVSKARVIAQRITSRPLLDPRSPRDILEEAWGVSGDGHR